MSERDWERYTRQMTLPEMGRQGQLRLSKARILVIGAGGLGSAVLPYLAGAGIGHLIIADGDRIRKHNLHRQILFQEKDIDQNKASIAGVFLQELNSDIRIDCIQEHVTEQNIHELIREVDLVVDCTDDLQAKALIAAASQSSNLPMVFGAVHGTEIQTGILIPPSPGLQEIFKLTGTQPPDCSTDGILGPVVGVAGTMMAWMIIEWFTQTDRFSNGEIRYTELREGSTYTLQIPRSLRPLNPKKEEQRMINEIDNQTLLQWKKSSKPYFLLDVREPHEREAMNIGGKHIPMGTISDHLSEIPTTEDVVVYCHAGVRSMRVLQFLQSQGYEKLYNLRGGISEWKARLGEEMAE